MKNALEVTNLPINMRYGRLISTCSSFLFSIIVLSIIKKSSCLCFAKFLTVISLLTTIASFILFIIGIYIHFKNYIFLNSIFSSCSSSYYYNQRVLSTARNYECSSSLNDFCSDDCKYYETLN